MAVERNLGERWAEKLCIVGFCQSSRDRTPWEDESWEIWNLNRGSIFNVRATRWFDLHSPTIRHWAHRRPNEHMKFLHDFPGPVYLHEVDPDLPNSVRYPFEEVTEDLGRGLWRLDEQGVRHDCLKTPYFDSSIAYEIALGIHLGFKQILVTGVDLNTAGEYVWQRSGVSYLLGVAQGRGIDVILPDNCPLLTGPLYGRGFLAEGGEHLSPSQLETRFETLKAEHLDLAAKINQMQGAHSELVNFTIKQMIPGVDQEKADQRRVAMEQQISAMQGKAEQINGAIKEVMNLMHTTPDGMTQEEAERQIRAREMADLDEKLHGYKRHGGEELSEGDMSALAVLDEQAPLVGHPSTATGQYYPSPPFVPVGAGTQNGQLVGVGASG